MSLTEFVGMFMITFIQNFSYLTPLVCHHKTKS